MDRANREVRKAIDRADLKHWQVAQQLDVHPSTLTVWLRTPLKKDRKKQVNKAIEHLTKANAG